MKDYINVFLVALFFFLSTQKSIAGECLPETIEIGHEFIEDNVVRFWVKNLPYDCLCKCPAWVQEANYGFFWKFGDGGYSFSSEPIYEFDLTTQQWFDKPFLVKVEVHPKWSDDDLGISEGSIEIEIDNIESIDEYQDDFQSIGTSEIFKILNNRNPVPGHHITLIINYNASILTQPELLTPNQQLITNPNTNIESFGAAQYSQNQSTFQSNYTNLVWGNKLSQGKHVIFIKYKIPSYLNPNNPDQNIIDIFLKKTTLLSTVLSETNLKLRLANSFDPNQKKVDISYIANQSILTYTIDFQNLGDGSTEYIKVVDNIHPLLELSPESFCLKEIQIGDDSILYFDSHTQNDLTFQEGDISYSIDLDNRTITFWLNPAILAGLADAGANIQGCADNLTTGYIKYSISTVNIDNEPNLTSFGTKALIYFDENGAIHTNHAYTQIDRSNNDCPFNEEVLNPLTTSQNVIVENNIVLSSNCYITSGITAVFDAGNSITLYDVYIEGGSDVWLKIDGCTYSDETGVADIEIESTDLVGSSNSDGGSGKVPEGKPFPENPNELFLTNYPNPFSQNTTLEYNLTEDSPVILSIISLTGQEVSRFESKEAQTEGVYQIPFDASKLPSGTYICILQTNYQTFNHKMTLVN